MTPHTPMTSVGRQGAHRVERLSVCLHGGLSWSQCLPPLIFHPSNAHRHTACFTVSLLLTADSSPPPFLSLYPLLPPSLRSVELRTWGGRDVNITSKNVRNLLEAVVLKGIVKNIKVRTSYIDNSLLPFLHFSSLLSPSSSSHPSFSRAWACLILSQPPPWPRRLASRV